MAEQAHFRPHHVAMCVITFLQRVVKAALLFHFYADYRGTRDSADVMVLERLLKTGEKMVKARSFEVLQARNKSAHLPRTESICADEKEYDDTPVRRTSSELQMIP